MVFPKAFANMMATRGDYKILSMKSKDAGSLNVEIIPCTSEGKEIDPKSIQINDPKRDLVNKTVNFLLKINDVKGLNPAYEDVYCQFSIFNVSLKRVKLFFRINLVYNTWMNKYFIFRSIFKYLV